MATSPKTLTHGQVVNYAIKFLRKLGCKVYFAEPQYSGHKYSPDALGWQWSYTPDCRNVTSHLVEAKVSKSDFSADQRKLIHDRDHADAHPGVCRWFIIPDYLGIKTSAIPAGWGLVTVSATGKLEVILEATASANNDARRSAEQPYLLSALHRQYFDVPLDTETGRFETVADNTRRKIAERRAKYLNE